MQFFAVQLPGSTPGGFIKALGEKKEMFMHIALGVAFGMIATAPFIGRWRANIWLKNHMPAEPTMKSFPEVA